MFAWISILFFVVVDGQTWVVTSDEKQFDLVYQLADSKPSEQVSLNMAVSKVGQETQLTVKGLTDDLRIVSTFKTSETDKGAAKVYTIEKFKESKSPFMGSIQTKDEDVVAFLFISLDQDDRIRKLAQSAVTDFKSLHELLEDPFTDSHLKLLMDHLYLFHLARKTGDKPFAILSVKDGSFSYEFHDIMQALNVNYAQGYSHPRDMGQLNGENSTEVFLGVADSTSERKYILKKPKANDILKLIKVLEKSKEEGMTLDDLFYYAYDCFHDDDVKAIQEDLDSIKTARAHSPEPRTLTPEQSLQEHRVKKMLVEHRRARNNQGYDPYGITAVTVTRTEERHGRFLVYNFEYAVSNKQLESCKVTVSKKTEKSSPFSWSGWKTTKTPKKVISVEAFNFGDYNVEAVSKFDKFGSLKITNPQSPFIAVVQRKKSESYTLIFVGMEAADIAKLSDAIQSLTPRENDVFKHFREAFPDKTPVSIRAVVT